MVSVPTLDLTTSLRGDLFFSVYTSFAPPPPLIKAPPEERHVGPKAPICKKMHILHRIHSAYPHTHLVYLWTIGIVVCSL